MSEFDFIQESTRCSKELADFSFFLVVCYLTDAKFFINNIKYHVAKFRFMCLLFQIRVTLLLVTCRHQHPFTTNQIERIELHVLIVYLFHFIKHIKFGRKDTKNI